MGQLRDRMADDLRLKGYCSKTRQTYLRCAFLFAAFWRRSPAELGEPQVRQYVVDLIEKKMAGPARVKTHVAALKFLYTTTLRRPEVVASLPWPKVPRTLPDILSGEEVLRVLGAIPSPVHRAVLLTAYAAGLRITEACGLEIGDIDSARKLIHVRNGKRGRDRYVMLSERLLFFLRTYWRLARPTGPQLFPGQTPGRPISPGAVRHGLRRAVGSAGVRKRVTPHVLRHTFATHLLESGVDVRTIQVLLGHGSIRTTERYTQVSQRHIARTKSPLDRLPTKDGPPLR